MVRWIVGSLLVMLVATSSGCIRQEPARPSAVTPGMAKKHITPGRTGQAEVLEIFGPPNIVTHKAGREVWTYDKMSHEVVNSGGFLTILLAGYARERSSGSSRSTMLIIYFDKNDVVTDYALHATQF